MTPSSMRAQRGFTLPELLVAMGLLSVLILVSLGALQFFTKTVDARTYNDSGATSVERTLATMRTDADTAFAVFVPKNDVFGAPNTVAGNAHEVDYYAKTDTGTETWWAYHYDANAQTLQRYDYDPTARTHGVFDRATGAVDPTGHYPKVTGISAFAASPLQADTLTNVGKNPYAPLVQTMVGAGATPQADPVGFVPANGQARTDLYGGNTTVQVTLTGRDGPHILHLTTGTMPSGFTVHESFAIKALVYRLDTIHRSWLGFAQKTHAQIFEQLQYSFHPKTDPASKWKVWCDFQVYGYGSGGLALNDPNASYRPYQNWDEAASAIYYNVTHGEAQKLNPLGCNQKVPSITSTPAPQYTGTSPDVTDTPPPCFLAGVCWPDNAPPNWSPPSPWPMATPPPAWCATHQQSTLCGGGGGTPVPVTSLPPAVIYSDAPTASPTSGNTQATMPTGRIKPPDRPVVPLRFGGGILSQ